MVKGKDRNCSRK